MEITDTCMLLYTLTVFISNYLEIKWGAVANLVEIRIPKKFSVCIFILIPNLNEIRAAVIVRYGSPKFLCFLFDLLEPWDVRALSIRKTADLPLQLWVGTFPHFVAIRFYFLSETLI
jgi:hypothetical protein